MAFDKLVDSAALEANLKAVADAIRSKAGGSDALAFPAGFAEAIAAIEAGGGGGKINGVSYVCGSITPDADITSTLMITHDAIPDSQLTYDTYVVWASAGTIFDSNDSYRPNGVLFGLSIPFHTSSGNERNLYNLAYVNASGIITRVNETFVRITENRVQPNFFYLSGTSSKAYLAGTTYNWMRIGGII